MSRPSPTIAAFAALSALVLAACATAASPGNTASNPSTSATLVQVKLTDAFRIEPASIRAPKGTVVTFVVSNTGALEHEFFVGSQAEQDAHERTMGASGMVHDEATGIAVKPGATRELTITLPASGVTLVGCHFPGHYAAGMKATITVE